MATSRGLLRGVAAPRVMVMSALWMKKESEKMPKTMPAEAGSAYGLERYWSRNWAGNVEVSRAQRVCPS